MVQPARVGEEHEIIYDERRWRLLKEFRERAKPVMNALVGAGFQPLVHGSLARGDVDSRSDIDAVIPFVVPSFRVELALRQAGLKIWRREVVMATPWQLPKAHVYLDEQISVTFPLVKPKPLEVEFYYFGGALDSRGLEEGRRVPGVDKRLMLIEPTPRGHRESTVVGREAEVARTLRVSLEIVRERVQVLTRRSEIGHTGLFIHRELAPEDTFEQVFRDEVLTNPAARQRLRGGEI